MASLPPPRHVLTSLISAIANIPLQPPEAAETQDTRTVGSATVRRLGIGLGGAGGGGQQSASNVLRRVPASHRHLIVTLHVLFPSLVLPALDLLDRGLVSRLVLELDQDRKDASTAATSGIQKPYKGEGHADASVIADTASDTHLHPDNPISKSNPEGKEKEKTTTPSNNNSSSSSSNNSTRPESGFFLVRSAQEPPRSRRHYNRHRRNNSSSSGFAAAAAGQATYMVRLDAWNCTCAGFAFAAFAHLSGRGEGEGNGGRGRGSVGDDDADEVKSGKGKGKGEGEHTYMEPGVDSATTGGGDDDDDDDGEGRAKAVKDDDGLMMPDQLGWSFGGASLDGTEGGGDDVPICKHLLACLLAERWEPALGRYVVERKLRKEEMAGIVADI